MYAPKVTGCISILCTFVILWEIGKDKRHQRLPITPVTRAVAGMSIFVLLVGFAWFLSTWAVPHTTYCRLQGFLLQLALGPPLYNAAILLYANLTIVRGWQAAEILQLEWIVHGTIWLWCLFNATLLLIKDKYHSIGSVCWASDPPVCYDANATADDLEGVLCNAKKYSAVLYCFPLWIALSYTLYGCVRVLVHVRNLPKRSVTAKSANEALEQRARTLTILYSAAILITYVPCIVWSVTFWFDYTSEWLNLLYVLLEPLQGAWNLAIFLMNRRQSTREWMWNLLMASCGACFRSRKILAASSSTDGEEEPDSAEQQQQQQQEQRNIVASSWKMIDGNSCEACV